MADSPLQRALDRYAQLTDELSELYPALAAARGAEIRDYAEVWENTYNLGVTERKETTRTSVAHQAAEVARIDADIQVALAELRYLDHLLRVLQIGVSSG